MILPKGITTTSYTTKQGKKIKFQVRFQDNDFKTCRTFDSLDKAVEYLHQCKSKYSRMLLTEQNELKKALVQSLLEPSLKAWMQRHLNYRYGNLDLTQEIKRKQLRLIKSCYKIIWETPVEYKTSYFPVANEDNLLGNFRLQEITPNVINSFIRKRLQNNKKISVSTYVSYLSRFFNDIQYLDDRLSDFNNPCLKYDKKLLRNAVTRTAKSISNENIDLLRSELAKSPNKDVLNIFNLALETACRRSELITLQFENIYIVNQEYPYILLKNTKSDPDRVVYLNDVALNILQDLINKSTTKKGRIFTTSINAFERVFRLSVKRLGLDKQVNFHMTRKTKITNLMLKAGNNAILVSTLLGFNSPQKILANHKQDLHNNSLEEQLRQIAHKNINTTMTHYVDTNLNK